MHVVVRKRYFTYYVCNLILNSQVSLSLSQSECRVPNIPDSNFTSPCTDTFDGSAPAEADSVATFIFTREMSNFGCSGTVISSIEYCYEKNNDSAENNVLFHFLFLTQNGHRMFMVDEDIPILISAQSQESRNCSVVTSHTNSAAVASSASNGDEDTSGSKKIYCDLHVMDLRDRKLGNAFAIRAGGENAQLLMSTNPNQVDHYRVTGPGNNRDAVTVSKADKSRGPILLFRLSSKSFY